MLHNQLLALGGTGISFMYFVTLLHCMVPEVFYSQFQFIVCKVFVMNGENVYSILFVLLC